MTRAPTPQTTPTPAPTPTTRGRARTQGPPSAVPGETRRVSGPPLVTLTASDGVSHVLPGDAVSLEGGIFSPSEAWQRRLAEARHRAVQVPVTVGGFARGTLSIHQAGSRQAAPQYATEKQEALELIHPALEPLRALNIHPVLVVSVSNNRVRGHATVMRQRNKTETPADAGALYEAIRKNAAALGWLGMDVFSGSAKNSFENGVLSLELNNFNFKLAGFLDGKGSIALENDKVTRFLATARIRVPSLKEADFTLERDQATGKLKGTLDVELTFKRFHGLIHARYIDGRVEIEGKVPINVEKFSGDVNFLVTDAATARDLALQHLGEAAIKAAAEADGGAKPAANRPPPRPRGMAIAGWASVNYHFNDWLTGAADIVVDSSGNFTVVGDIRPQKNVPLFGPRGLDKTLFKVSIQAEYGIPYVGGIGIGVDIGLHFVAEVGPGVIDRIVVPFKYSTDPRISTAFAISGHLNISAYAALVLAVEAYAVLTILSHDIKAGVGVKAAAGVRAYVDAELTFGYREPQPVGERKGEFYFGGHGEFAAQPFLALRGYLYIALETPWWSPVSDHRWEWPIGSLEYGLPGEFGLGLDVPEYVIGSGKWPEVKTSSVAFDKDKFMADVLDDKVGQKSHGEEKKPAKWSTTTKPPPPPPPAPPAPAAKQPKTGRQRPGPSKVTDPAVVVAWKAVMPDMQRLAQQSNARPFGPAELERAIVSLRQRHPRIQVEPKRVGQNWQLHVTIGASSRDFNLKGRPAEAAEAKDVTGGAQGAGAVTDAPLRLPDRSFKNEGGVQHLLSLQVRGDSVSIIIQSNPAILEQYLKNLPPPRPTDALLKQIQDCIAKIQSEKGEHGRFGKGAGERISKLFNQLVELLQHVQDASVPYPPDATDAKWPQKYTVKLKSGQSEELSQTMVADPLTIKPGLDIGYAPAHKGLLWQSVSVRNAGEEGRVYIRGHLLNHNLFGPGDRRNLVPMSVSLNTLFEKNIESNVKTKVLDEKKRVRYQVNIHFPASPGPRKYLPDEAYVPSTITASLKEYRYTSGKWELGSRELLSPASVTGTPVPDVALTDQITKFNDFRQKVAAKPAKAYKMADTYSVGEVIRHPTFGLGFIVRLEEAPKLIVRFEDNQTPGIPRDVRLTHGKS